MVVMSITFYLIWIAAGGNWICELVNDSFTVPIQTIVAVIVVVKTWTLSLLKPVHNILDWSVAIDSVKLLVGLVLGARMKRAASSGAQRLRILQRRLLNFLDAQHVALRFPFFLDAQPGAA